jgi:hypothetical protein
MRITIRRAWFLRELLVCLAAFSALPNFGYAQKQGANAVWASGGNPTPSYAFIDATQFSGDICGQINAALVFAQVHSSLFPDGVVIDARGIISSSSQTCLNSPFPSNSPPSTILLPASTIVMSGTWTVPNQTRIIGAVPVSPTLQAATSSQGGFTGSDMIEMGSATLCLSGCSGISLEHLRLDAQQQAVNGIHNVSAQDQSFVDDIVLASMSQTGLWIDTGATGSGPWIKSG